MKLMSTKLSICRTIANSKNNTVIYEILSDEIYRIARQGLSSVRNLKMPVDIMNKIIKYL